MMWCVMSKAADLTPHTVPSVSCNGSMTKSYQCIPSLRSSCTCSRAGCPVLMTRCLSSVSFRAPREDSISSSRLPMTVEGSSSECGLEIHV